MGCGNGSAADIDCRMAARRVERTRHQRVIALPPPPDPPFDIETMELVEAPPHGIWRDDFEEFGPDRLTEADPDWAAPELARSGKQRTIASGKPLTGPLYSGDPCL